MAGNVTLKKALFCIFGFSIVFCSLAFSQPAKTVQLEPLSKPALSGEMGEGAVYTLGKNDVVEILVRNQPEFSGTFVVGPDGDIQYAFVGDIKAETLTKDQLKDVITSKLEQYIKIPEVSVTIAAYRSKFVYILGEVGRPGKYPLAGNSISLRDALVGSGLPTAAAALRRVYVIKPDEVAPTFEKLDIYEILYEGKLEKNVTLLPGELVVVPATIPSEINRALSNILSPLSRTNAIDTLIRDWGGAE